MSHICVPDHADTGRPGARSAAAIWQADDGVWSGTRLQFGTPAAVATRSLASHICAPDHAGGVWVFGGHGIGAVPRSPGYLSDVWSRSAGASTATDWVYEGGSTAVDAPGMWLAGSTVTAAPALVTAHAARCPATCLTPAALLRAPRPLPACATFVPGPSAPFFAVVGAVVGVLVVVMSSTQPLRRVPITPECDAMRVHEHQMALFTSECVPFNRRQSRAAELRRRPGHLALPATSLAVGPASRGEWHDPRSEDPAFCY